MAKVTKVFMWVSIVAGIVGLVTPWVVELILLNSENGYGFGAGYANSIWWVWTLKLSVIGFVALLGLVWLIYLIIAGVKALRVAVRREQDTRPKLLNVQQRIVVWVVAAVLTVISVAYGIRFNWRRDSILWIAVFPVILIGAAVFVHVMRRRE